MSQRRPHRLKPETPLAPTTGNFLYWGYPRNLIESCRLARGRCAHVQDEFYCIRQVNNQGKVKFKFFCQKCSRRSCTFSQWCTLCRIYVHDDKVKAHCEGREHRGLARWLGDPNIGIDYDDEERFRNFCAAHRHENGFPLQLCDTCDVWVNRKDLANHYSRRQHVSKVIRNNLEVHLQRTAAAAAAAAAAVGLDQQAQLYMADDALDDLLYAELDDQQYAEFEAMCADLATSSVGAVAGDALGGAGSPTTQQQSDGSSDGSGHIAKKPRIAAFLTAKEPRKVAAALARARHGYARRAMPSWSHSANETRSVLRSRWAAHGTTEPEFVHDDDDGEPPRGKEDEEERGDRTEQTRWERTVKGSYALLRWADTELAELRAREDDDDRIAASPTGRTKVVFSRALPQTEGSTLRDIKHLPEATRVVFDWAEDMLKRQFQRPLPEELADGTDLCALVNRIKPGAVPAYNCKPASDAERLENAEAFLRAAKSLGVDELFEPKDIGTDFGRVVHCLLALGEYSERHFAYLPKLRAVRRKHSLVQASLVHDSDSDDDAPPKKITASFLRRYFPSVHDIDDNDETTTAKQRELVAKLDVSGAIVSEHRHAKATTPLIVWSMRDESSAKYDDAERKLCRLLRSKGKLFEVVYLDITPEREIELRLTCPNYSLPALTVRSEHVNPSAKGLDAKLRDVPAGRAFWVMPEPHEWHHDMLGQHA